MSYFDELARTLTAVQTQDIASLLAFVRACEGTLWLAGNGGSAANAQHWACDLSKAANRRVQALGTNLATLTAWANDEGYEHALRLEFLRLWQLGDRLICISCSGTSKNIEQLISEAHFRDVPVAIVTGVAWEDPYYRPIEVVVNVPHDHYGVIEDCHMAIGHWLTEELRK